jgi:putative DNA primase/helicase
MADITNIFGGEFVYVPPTDKPFVEPPEVQLQDAMRREGLDPPASIHLDGKLHRFNTGKRKDLSAWYVAFGDGIPAGRFGDWRSGTEKTWRATLSRAFTPAEEMAFTRRLSEAKATRDAELERTRETASTVVDKIWSDGMAASPDHPYLARKGIGVNCARVTGDGRLMVPLYSPDGTISSLQYISDDGDKKYHPGGATGGKFWSVGTDDSTIYIAEGFATAATIHEETGNLCIVAYSASNLVPALAAMRDIHGPAKPIIIVADNDASGVGQRYAEQAAAKYGARIVVPPIEGDANDFRQAGKDLKGLLQPPVTGSDIISKLDAVFGNQLGDAFSIPNELVEGLIVIGSQTVIYGDSNSGKTFLALSLAAAVAEGESWFGRQTDRGVVVYLATESPSSVRTRVQALKRHTGWSLEHLVIVQVPINFYEGDGDAQDVIELVRVVEDQTGAPVRMIIGDTLARMSAGADENRGSDMGPVMARFDAVAKETQAAMVIIHHNGKNAAAGARGWSGIRAHIDTEIEVVSDETGRRATITKQRELPGKGDDILFKLDIIEIGTTKFGGIATTCVAVPDDVERPARAEKDSPIKKHQKSFETAWWACGAEDRDGLAYISRDALKAKLEMDGHAERTIRNMINPSYQDKLIGALITAGIIETHGNKGWILLDKIASFALLQRRETS